MPSQDKEMIMNKYEMDGPRAWLIVICGGFFYFYQFILRVFPNVIGDDIMQTRSIDAGVWGFILGFFYWAYSALQLPLGISMDRWGPRSIIAGACFLCGSSCALFALSNSVTFLCVARFMMGMGAACGFLGTLKLGSLWFSPLKFPRVIGTTLVFGTLGANMGLTGFGFIVIRMGWEKAMFLLAVMGASIGVLILAMVKDSPKFKYARKFERLRAYKKAQNDHMLQGLFRIIKKPQAWVIAVYGMLMYIPLTIMGDAWGGPFLTALYGDEQLALSIVGMMFIGAAVGSPVFPYFSDYLVRRQIPMALGSFGALCIYIIILYVPGVPVHIMYGLFFLVGFFYTAKSLTFASICEIMPRHESGVSVGFANTVVMIQGIFSHPFIGVVLDSVWDGKMIHGKPIYSVENYRLALCIIPCALLLSLITLLFSEETHPGYLRKDHD